jgi:hypothetical protein
MTLFLNAVLHSALRPSDRGEVLELSLDHSYRAAVNSYLKLCLEDIHCIMYAGCQAQCNVALSRGKFRIQKVWIGLRSSSSRTSRFPYDNSQVVLSISSSSRSLSC